jgi:hypothetical protein
VGVAGSKGEGRLRFAWWPVRFLQFEWMGAGTAFLSRRRFRPGFWVGLVLRRRRGGGQGVSGLRRRLRMRSRVGVGRRWLGRGSVGNAPSSRGRISLSTRGSLLCALLCFGLCWPPSLLLVRRLARGMDGGRVRGANGWHIFGGVRVRWAWLEQAANWRGGVLWEGAFLGEIGAGVGNGIRQLVTSVVGG